jgi:hypothetical protein
MSTLGDHSFSLGEDLIGNKRAKTPVKNTREKWPHMCDDIIAYIFCIKISQIDRFSEWVANPHYEPSHPIGRDMLNVAGANFSQPNIVSEPCHVSDPTLE